MSKNQAIVFITIFWLFIFNSCQTSVQKSRLSPEDQSELISKGKKITLLSFKSFSSELMKALQDGSIQHAVGYCHLKASPILDSITRVYEVNISRVSDKYRNPVNKPGKLDLTVIEAYRQQLKDGQELQPHLEITADEVVFYSPILLLNPACLLCHGEPGSTMEQENFDFITSIYVDDLATGYKLGDLRGVWRIEF